MIKEFATYLATGLELTVGQSLFAGHVPEGEPDLCTVILERTPAYSEPGLRRHREWHFQLYTRGASYFAARTEAHRVFDWALGKRGVLLPSWFIVSITGSAPGFIGPDASGRASFSANLSLPAHQREGG
jgi:hypothetical protein